MIFGYTRVSTDEQADGTSLDTQQRQITGVAMASNLDTQITWLSDAGVSGASDFFSRPAVATLDLVEGDIIICSALDRFSRDARDCLNAIHELKGKGVRLFLNGHGDVTDDANTTGRLMLEVMAAFAGHERRAIKERCNRGRQAKKAKQGHIGGSAPWGYCVIGEGKEARIEQLPIRARAVATMVALKHQGKSLRAIAEQVSSLYDLPTSHMAVKRALDGRGKPI